MGGRVAWVPVKIKRPPDRPPLRPATSYQRAARRAQSSFLGSLPLLCPDYRHIFVPRRLSTMCCSCGLQLRRVAAAGGAVSNRGVDTPPPAPRRYEAGYGLQATPVFKGRRNSTRISWRGVALWRSAAGWGQLMSEWHGTQAHRHSHATSVAALSGRSGLNKGRIQIEGGSKPKQGGGLQIAPISM